MRIRELRIVVLLAAALTGLVAEAQRVSAWTGRAYELTDYLRQKGYAPEVRGLRVLDPVRYERLDFPDRDEFDSFGEVYLIGAYGLLLDATLAVDTPGVYRFTLASDDGSRLWLDGAPLVDNDGKHRVREASGDTLLLAGTYALELWYYNGFSPRMALQFAVERVADAAPVAAAPPTFSLAAGALFASGSAALGSRGELALQPACDALRDRVPRRLRIVGHTDAQGSEASNEHLSRRRAEAVLAALRACAALPPGLQAIVEGRGEREPVATNGTAEGRAANRRVELYVD